MPSTSDLQYLWEKLCVVAVILMPERQRQEDPRAFCEDPQVWWETVSIASYCVVTIARLKMSGSSLCVLTHWSTTTESPEQLQKFFSGQIKHGNCYLGTQVANLRPLGVGVTCIIYIILFP